MKIGELLATIKGEVGAVQKGQQMNGGGGGPRYNFRGIDAVVNACHGAFVKHKVVMVPFVQTIEYVDVLIGGQGKRGVSVRVVADFTFYGPEGDTITARVAGEGQDQADKGTAKAQSVAMRVALLQALGLPTDDPDPDSQWEEQQPAPPLEAVELRERAIAIAKDLGMKGPDLAAEFASIGGQGRVSESVDIPRLGELVEALQGAQAGADDQAPADEAPADSAPADENSGEGNGHDGQ
ncbi:ERF family ssDNA binding protein [Gordonia phage Dardanus]|uniref:ERF family ssDNA binding protein n=1 Tax=Gordonia phage Dardanus TaxID=2588489 RepID=A0A514CX65_9CAUD|nr:RecA-like DNA recombinase [Gordonia phage Dardanus]QDH85081.1 ERF family ssDNA binding protein [Gordonia phage Dardanus]